MSLITITSDFGSKDHYLAVMKGELYSQIDTLSIVDITNDIEKFNLPQAAFVIKHAYNSFPKNTVHLVMVGSGTADTDFLIVKSNDQYFIGLDNGLFALIFESEPIFAYRLTINPPPELFSFPEKEILPKAASHLLRGGVPEVIAEPIQQLKPMIGYTPIVQDDFIRATVLFIDGYGNVITNVSKTLFNQIRRDRKVDIGFRVSREHITIIHRQYADVPQGEVLALFNSSGLLEIAINQGDASGLLGIAIYENLSIRFK